MRFIPKSVIDPGGRKRRAANLKRLCAAWPHELVDTSIGGRMRIIQLLTEADRIQKQVKGDSPDYYDPAFHLQIQNAIRTEREGLAAMTRGLPADHPMMQLRLIK